MTLASSSIFRRIRIRWHQSNPWLRIGIQAGLVAVMVGGGFALLMVRNDINDTAASVMVAIVFGVTTVLQLRQSQRRQHTVELITNFQSTETLAAADIWMAGRIAAGRPVGGDVTPEESQHVITILDYYEFLSTLGARGIIDVRLLLRLRGGTMKRCFDTCRMYIEHRRAQVGDELYRSFETLVDVYGRRHQRDRSVRSDGPAQSIPRQTPKPDRHDTEAA